MRDRNSGFRSLGVWLVAGLFLSLALTAGAASGGDNAAWVSYSGVPSAMHPGDTATVTVTMRNTGTTTWKATVVTETDDSVQTTTRTIFSLDAVGHDWGVNGVAVSGSVAPNATRSFQFTITAPETTTKRNYVFRWQMARDTVVTERPIHARSPGTFGAATPSRTIQVGPDMAPSFGNEEIDPLVWLRGMAIDPVTLPAATGGNGNLSYSLTSCYLPGGVTFNRATRTFSGTPRTVWGPTTCTYKVTDSDDNTAASDGDTLEFTITVLRPVLTVSPSSLTEPAIVEGGSRTFTVRPASAPNGTVTVRVSSDDTAVATVKPASLTFTGTNYTTPKTVTVTGAQDPDAADESTTVRLRASSGGYNNVSASVSVTVDDDDIPALLASPSSQPGLTVPEGGSGSFEVSLATQPTHTVTVRVSSGDTGAVGVSTSSLTFTRTNYSRSQTVTVDGEQDPDASDESTTVSLRASGGDYGGIEASVDVTVEDDDTPALVVNPSSLTVDEGGSGSFEVSLATQPTHTVTVRVSSGDTGAVGVRTASLTFTRTNYSRSQTVTVDGEQDPDASDESTTVSLRASGGDYGGIEASVDVTVEDDDTPALVVNPSSLTVDEGGSGSFEVSLATQPTHTVTVRVSSGDTGAVGVSTSSLTFTRDQLQQVADGDGGRRAGPRRVRREHDRQP